MKVKIKTTVETEKEITFPYYFKLNYNTAGCIYYGIINETKTISINRDEVVVLSTENMGDNLSHERFIESNAGEFITQFDKAVESLQQLVKNNL